MACNWTSTGINDNNSTVSFLATRIFDNVRFDLDREQLLLSASIPEDATPLYATGTGSSVQLLNASPRCNDNFSNISGNLLLPCVLTYISGGASNTVPCTVSVPFSARMKLPQDSVWPYDITLNYSCFCDNIVRESENTFSCLADGVTITYITASVPVCVPASGQLQYNSISEREVDLQNGFVSASFYPSTVCNNEANDIL